ncbi:hypothetical protein D3C72_1655120 [compost metagenome]
MAESADFAADQLRLGHAQAVGIEPVLRRRAGPQVVEENVGALRDQLVQLGKVAGILDVKADEALAAVDGMEGRAAALPLARPPAARRIARGPFDLPDVRAESCKNLAGERRRSAVAQFDHDHTVERQVMHC